MNRFYKFDLELIKQLVADSTSLTQVCEKLLISSGGYSTKSLREYLEENNIDYSHFTQTKSPRTRESYEENPKLCKCCGNPLPWEKRNNEFCNNSCAASYNNTVRETKPRSPNKNPLSTILDEVSDEKFIEVINSSTTWKEILEGLGYANTSNENAKNKIRSRAEELNISLNIRIRETRDWNQITKGELFSYCKNWLSARTQIRKIAYKSFKENNKSYECAICGYNKHVEIAHVKAVSDFDDNTTVAEINKPSNLIGLCPTHHWEFDNNAMSEEDLLKIKQQL